MDRVWYLVSGVRFLVFGHFGSRVSASWRLVLVCRVYARALDRVWCLLFVFWGFGVSGVGCASVIASCLGVSGVGPCN